MNKSNKLIERFFKRKEKIIINLLNNIELEFKHTNITAIGKGYKRPNDYSGDWLLLLKGLPSKYMSYIELIYDEYLDLINKHILIEKNLLLQKLKRNDNILQHNELKTLYAILNNESIQYDLLENNPYLEYLQYSDTFEILNIKYFISNNFIEFKKLFLSNYLSIDNIEHYSNKGFIIDNTILNDDMFSLSNIQYNANYINKNNLGLNIIINTINIQSISNNNKLIEEYIKENKYNTDKHIDKNILKLRTKNALISEILSNNNNIDFSYNNNQYYMNNSNDYIIFENIIKDSILNSYNKTNDIAKCNLTFEIEMSIINNL